MKWNPFKRKSRGNHYKVIAVNEEHPLKSIVLFNNNYVMWLGTAKINETNRLPVEEWFYEHFMFKDESGEIYADTSAGLRYSCNMKFKFSPNRLYDIPTVKEDESQEPLLLEYKP